MDKDLELAKQELNKNPKNTAVLVKNGKVLAKKNSRGIKPILELTLEFKKDLNGASIADKVTGKAAAMICAHYKIKSLYTKVISKEAQNYLNPTDIYVEYDKAVDFILNRSKTNKCPMEKISETVDTYTELIKKIQEFLQN